MLKANVGLSRKITRDYNSIGYSVNLDGEIPFPLNDVEGVMDKIGELFDLAEEALQREIEGKDGQGTAEPRYAVPSTPPVNNVHANGQARPNASLPMNRSNYGNTPATDAATPKQLQFLQTMARRCKLNDQQLETRITEVVGRACPVQQLTKKEAGRVIDTLTGGKEKAGN
jgi:hypothetical protein